MRYAFIKDDLPDVAPKIMVAIVQIIDEEKKTGELIDACIVADKAELNEYLNEWLGVDRPVEPVYTRTQQ
jgi:hypothetical protein